MKKFDAFRFEGLSADQRTNKYLTMNRVSEDEKKIVVKVADSHLIQTRYGFALILDATRVVFLKDWQVSINYYGNEILLNKDYFNAKLWGDHSDFFDNDEAVEWSYWLDVAKEQRETPVKWESHK